MQFELGDIVKLKKKHPCGSSEWEILRVGANYGIQEACGKKHKGNTKKGLIWQGICGKVTTCEKLQIPCSFYLRQCRYAGGEGQRPKGGTTA